MRTNRKHKDRLFRFIFEEKENLLQLYNAINGTNYSNTEDLEIVTLKDIIYMRMKNDISFLIDCQLNLFEHQSSDNPNMPLRGLLYLARQYEKYVKINNYNIYGTKRIPIPTPQYIIFYNGDEWGEERKLWKLSDSFARDKENGCMELEVLQLNINYGHNKEIMEKCRPLWEYTVFVGKVKHYNMLMNVEDAVDRAVDECIKEEVQKEILIAHRAEVKDMLLTEYDEAETLRMFKRDWDEEVAEELNAAKEKARVAEENARVAEKKAREAKENARAVEQEKKEMQAKIEELQRKLEEATGKK